VTPEDEEHWERVGAQAQEQARSGRLSEAEALARSIPDASSLAGCFHERIVAFEELGRALVRAGHGERAAAILGEAEQMARRLGPGAEWLEAEALFDIGNVWRESGNVTEATRLWDAAVDVAARGRGTRSLLARIARTLHEQGFRDRALRVAQLRPLGLGPPRRE
jgi:ATP/maltotriose-dependent transcriptional regulator MalT